MMSAPHVPFVAVQRGEWIARRRPEEKLIAVQRGEYASDSDSDSDSGSDPFMESDAGYTRRITEDGAVEHYQDGERVSGPHHRVKRARSTAGR